MLKYGAERLLAMIGDDSVNGEEVAARLDAIVTEYEHVWSLRNRPGGMSNSVARLTRKKSPYFGRSVEDLFKLFDYLM